MKFSLKIIVINVNKKSQNLAQNVSPNESLECTLHYHETTLDWIFRRDVSICNSSDHSYTKIHCIKINLIPGQEDELIKCPTVINPYYIWSSRAIVIAFVQIIADFVEDDSHKMSIEVCINDEFKYEKEGVANERQLSESLYFFKNIT